MIHTQQLKLPLRDVCGISFYSYRESKIGCKLPNNIFVDIFAIGYAVRIGNDV